MNRRKLENGPSPAPPPPKLFVCPPKPETAVSSPAKPPAYSRKWVDWSASQITDPVLRLKFLQQTAPRMRLELFWKKWRMVFIFSALGLLAAAPAGHFLNRAGSRVEPALPPPAPVAAEPVSAAPGAPPPEVWQVEKTASSETYSNGLRIDTRFTVSNHPRAYLAFPAGGSGESEGVRRTEPAGIVFHTTESRQAPFEADQNGVLKKIGESLLEYVRRKRAYHFLIDRFGRVYRVVAESDAANHAGNSVWADERWLYVNLNQSFLSISIEARTRPGQVEAQMSPAQLHSAAMLTEMLRSRYHVAAANCVTHAQVSVNPSNRQVGYHTDWASSFPFEQLALPDNYARALPALWAFGFEYNPEFLHWAGSRIALGVQLGEERLNQQAAEAGVSARAYRKTLQKRYRVWLEEVRRANAAEDEESE